MIQTVRDTRTTDISKSFTLLERYGNFHEWLPWTWKYIQTLPDTGMLNAYGLTNPGTLPSLRMIRHSIELGFNVVPSFYPEFSTESGALSPTLMHRIFKVRTLEINASCPNVRGAIDKNIRDTLALVSDIRAENPELVIIVKISYVHPYSFAVALEEAGADVIHAINTIPWNIVFPGKTSPLAKHGWEGGVSGGPAQQLAMKYIKELRKCIRGPMIAGCGICNLEDAREYFSLLAPNDSISICTVALRNPKEATRILETYNKP
jgi:dihydroorotate dehydrogenase (NAD+) catalytic subunit